MNKQVFGDRLRIFLKAQRLTQKKLAEILGVHEKSVQNHVRGKTIPSLSVLELMAKKVGISPTWLITGEGEMLIDAGGERGGVSSEERKLLLTGFSRLDTKRRQSVYKVMATLLKVQNLDKSEDLGEAIKKVGSSPEHLTSITSAVSDLDTIEKEVIGKANTEVVLAQQSKAKEPFKEGKGDNQKKKKRARKLVPANSLFAAQMKFTSNSDLEVMFEFSPNLEKAFKKYETIWVELLESISDQ